MTKRRDRDDTHIRHPDHFLELYFPNAIAKEDKNGCKLDVNHQKIIGKFLLSLPFTKRLSTFLRLKQAQPDFPLDIVGTVLKV